jgi:hypothetical protein
MTPSRTAGRTLKTAAVAALGITIAAVAAGPAMAAPVEKAVNEGPLGQTVGKIPGASQSLNAATMALGYSTAVLPATVNRTLPAATQILPTKDLPTRELLPGGNKLPTDTVTKAVPGGLLGGLPL